MNRLWRWLLPGLNLKRWLLVFAAGVFLVGFSLSLLLEGGELYARVERGLRILTIQWAAEGLRIPVPLIAAVIGLTGLATAFWALWRLVSAILETLYPGERGRAERYYLRRQLFRGPKVVAIGGGTGLPAVLRGLKEYTANITAVVTVADDGGSSGRLRSEFNILPPGDIRNCLVALADTEPLLERLFQYRFSQGEGLQGHPFGNLFILALTETTGDFYTAIRESSQVLAVRGRVMPSTLSHVVLKAHLADGREVTGESAVGRAGAIRRVFLDPPDPPPLEDAIQALQEADAIVLGPGSLYTSVIPNLLVPGVAEAVRRSPALKIYVCNIMTQPGETDGYTASRHLRALFEHAGYGLVDYILVNQAPVPEPVLRRYRAEGAEPVRVDLPELQQLGVEVVQADLLEVSGGWVRHDPAKLAYAIVQLLLLRPARTDRSPWEQFWLRQRLFEQGRLSGVEGKVRLRMAHGPRGGRWR
ncbi:MAG: YvcK family protein [Bacillota bacterium]